MWVVKIGGSLESPWMLRQWLVELCEVGAGRVVIVPRGGDFADKVRQYQSEWRFDDLAAHNMCLPGMTRPAILMQGILPELVPLRARAKVRRALRDGRVAVWVPTSLMRDNAGRDEQLGHHLRQPRRVALDHAQRRAADRGEVMRDLGERSARDAGRDGRGRPEFPSTM